MTRFLIIAVVLLAVSLGGGGYFANRHIQQLHDEILQMRAEMTETRTALQNETAILHRAVGNVIPIQIPDELQHRLQELEKQVKNAASRPKSFEAAKALHQAIGNFVHQKLPPWAEEELLPRLNVLRWGSEVLLRMRMWTPLPEKDLERVEEEARHLAEARPDGVPDDLVGEWDGVFAKVREAATNQRRNAALEAAESALDGRGDAVKAVVMLEEFGQDDDARKARDKLRAYSLERETKQRVCTLRRTLTAAQQLPTEYLRQIGVAKVHDAAASLLMELRSEDSPRSDAIKEIEQVLDDCQSKSQEIAARQQKVMARKVSDYQRWAIRQIDRFDHWQYEQTLQWARDRLYELKAPSRNIKWSLLTEIPSAKQLLADKLAIDLSDVRDDRLTIEQQQRVYDAAWKTVGWTASIDQELAYRTTRDRMVECILPINPALLDPPVAQLYQKVFQKAWKQFEGRSEQLYIAEQVVVVTKRGIE